MHRTWSLQVPESGARLPQGLDAELGPIRRHTAMTVERSCQRLHLSLHLCFVLAPRTPCQPCRMALSTAPACALHNCLKGVRVAENIQTAFYSYRRM